MTSPSSNSGNDDGGARQGPKHRMIANAVHYSHASLQDRILMRRLVRELNKHDLDVYETPAVPPRSFRSALRRPVGSKRTTVTVTIGGQPVSLLLNPQGRTDAAREQWLWEYLRDLIEGDTE